MAAHGKTGEALERYRRRKRRPHVVPGLYASDGASSKPQVLTRDEYKVKLRHRGASRSGRKAGKKDAGAAATSRAAGAGIVHWRPVRCAGRAVR